MFFLHLKLISYVTSNINYTQTLWFENISAFISTLYTDISLARHMTGSGINKNDMHGTASYSMVFVIKSTLPSNM